MRKDYFEPNNERVQRVFSNLNIKLVGRDVLPEAEETMNSFLDDVILSSWRSDSEIQSTTTEKKGRPTHEYSTSKFKIVESFFGGTPFYEIVLEEKSRHERIKTHGKHVMDWERSYSQNGKNRKVLLEAWTGALAHTSLGFASYKEEQFVDSKHLSMWRDQEHESWLSGKYTNRGKSIITLVQGNPLIMVRYDTHRAGPDSKNGGRRVSTELEDMDARLDLIGIARRTPDFDTRVSLETYYRHIDVVWAYGVKVSFDGTSWQETYGYGDRQKGKHENWKKIKYDHPAWTSPKLTREQVDKYWKQDTVLVRLDENQMLVQMPEIEEKIPYEIEGRAFQRDLFEKFLEIS